MLITENIQCAHASLIKKRFFICSKSFLTSYSLFSFSQASSRWILLSSKGIQEELNIRHLSIVHSVKRLLRKSLNAEMYTLSFSWTIELSSKKIPIVSLKSIYTTNNFRRNFVQLIIRTYCYECLRWWKYIKNPNVLHITETFKRIP